MTGDNAETERQPQTQPQTDDVGSTLDAVRRAASEVLGYLSDHPERLRVSVANVSLDLDWRASEAPLRAFPDDGAGQTSIAGQASVAGQAVSRQAVLSGPAAPGQAGEAPSESPPDQPGEERLPVLHYVCAPSVGTFYRSPEPGAAPFTAEGATVTAGQQVAIVEAMKLMLPVEADRPGRVVEVLIEDGQAVEYGERLLALTPVGSE